MKYVLNFCSGIGLSPLSFNRSKYSQANLELIDAPSSVIDITSKSELQALSMHSFRIFCMYSLFIFITGLEHRLRLSFYLRRVLRRNTCIKFASFSVLFCPYPSKCILSMNDMHVYMFISSKCRPTTLFFFISLLVNTFLCLFLKKYAILRNMCA